MISILSLATSGLLVEIAPQRCCCEHEAACYPLLPEGAARSGTGKQVGWGATATLSSF